MPTPDQQLARSLVIELQGSIGIAVHLPQALSEETVRAQHEFFRYHAALFTNSSSSRNPNHSTYSQPTYHPFSSESFLRQTELRSEKILHAMQPQAPTKPSDATDEIHPPLSQTGEGPEEIERAGTLAQ